MDQDFRAHLRARCGHGCHHEFPFRHQLAGVHAEGRQHRRSLAGLRVLTAFFLEATFLGVMLFGRARVSDRVHFSPR